jgi:hypothetical protein
MEWRKRALREEQGTREETEARRKKAHSAHYPHRAAEVDEETSWNATPDIRRPWSGHGYGHRIAGVRYRFCVAVDEAALQSVISSEGETRTGIAWMKLIEGDWTPEDAAAQREETKIQYLANGLDLEDWDDEVEEAFLEIDGCTEENVGWMKDHYGDLIPLLCSRLMDNNAFGELYVRPPGTRAWWWLRKLLHYYVHATADRSVCRFTSNWKNTSLPDTRPNPDRTTTKQSKSQHDTSHPATSG